MTYHELLLQGSDSGYDRLWRQLVAQENHQPSKALARDSSSLFGSLSYKSMRLMVETHDMKSIDRLRSELDALHIELVTTELDFKRRASKGQVSTEIDTFIEVPYEPSESVIHAYRQGYAEVFDNVFQRFLLSRRLSSTDAVELLQSAVYGGLEFYISSRNERNIQTFRLTESQYLEATSIVGRYLGNVHERSRLPIATRVMADLVEQLEGRKIDLVTGAVSASRGQILIKHKITNVTSHQADKIEYALAA